MKLLKTFTICLFISPLISYAGTAQVPFENVEVKVGDTLHAQYNFPHRWKQTIVCSQSTQATGTVTVELQTTWYKVNLPVTLTFSPRFQGDPINMMGEFLINNEYGSPEPTSPMYVSCEYKDMS